MLMIYTPPVTILHIGAVFIWGKVSNFAKNFTKRYQ